MLISISIYNYLMLSLFTNMYIHITVYIYIYYLGQMSIFNRNKWPQAPLDAGSFWGSPRPVSTLDPWLLSQAAWYTSIVVSCCIMLYLYLSCGWYDGYMMLYSHIFTIIHSCCLYDHTSRREVDKEWFNMQINCCLRWSCGSAWA